MRTTKEQEYEQDIRRYKELLKTSDSSDDRQFLAAGIKNGVRWEKEYPLEYLRSLAENLSYSEISRRSGYGSETIKQALKGNEGKDTLKSIIIGIKYG